MRFSISLGSLLLLISSGLANGQEASARRLPLKFEGNKVFSSQELLEITNQCLTKTRPHYRSDSETLDYCLRKLRVNLAARGYLQAVVGKPKDQEIENELRLVIPITEGVQYRLGKVKIEGAKLFAPAQILEMLTLKSGDVADLERLTEWLDNRVRKIYANFGYIQYSSEPEPSFHLDAGASAGIVDLIVTIDEGQAFTIRSIKFKGNGNVPEDVLLREMLVRNGEVFNQELFDDSLRRINQTGQFQAIDLDRDVDYRWDLKDPKLDLTIQLKKKN